MKVLGILCSPQRHGNTAILLQKALEGARELGAEVELLNISDKTINFCDGCESCIETGECHINDDMQEIYTKLMASDGIIIATPVYFWDVSAQAKVFIDRTYALLHQRKLRNKVGGIAVVAARAGCSSACGSLRAFLQRHRMLEGGTAMAYGWKRGEVEQDEHGLREARAVGRAVVKAIQRLRVEEINDVGPLGATGAP